jgi:phage shock protein A
MADQKTTNEHELLHLLETRVRQLILQYKDLQEECRALEGQIAERDGKIEELKQQNRDAQARYENLKVARMLELSDSDTRNARQRLNRLVRDVDKCIALLKA